MTAIEQLEAKKKKLALELEIRALEMRKNALGKIHKRHYEGAARTQRTAGWKTPLQTGPVSTVAQALPVLRERSRDLVRNTGYGESAVSTIVSGMIGYGVATKIETQSKGRTKALQALWNGWAETVLCDVRRQSTLGGLQMQAIRSWVETGECLFRRVWRKSAHTGDVPFSIQLLDPELLDTSKEYRDKNTRQGIEFDENGAPVAYWLFPQHPMEANGMLQSVRVPADDVGHMFFVRRPGQVRGLPLLTPVIMKLHDLADYEDAQLVRQQLSACFMAFVTNLDGEPEYIKKGSGEEEPFFFERLQPGIVQQLNPGESVDFSNPPGADGYGEYTKAVLHSIAAGIGITYEDLTGDYSQVSWSSGRLARLKYYANLDAWQWQMFVPMFCDKIFLWFKEAAGAMGIQTADAVATYTMPRRPVADTNEYRNRMQEVRAGFKSIPEAIRENGYDPEQVLRETAYFLNLAKEYGVIVDCDPSQVSSQGQAQYTAEDLT